MVLFYEIICFSARHNKLDDMSFAELSLVVHALTFHHNGQLDKSRSSMIALKAQPITCSYTFESDIQLPGRLGKVNVLKAR